MDPPTSTSSVAPPPPPALAALPPPQSPSVLDIYSNQLLPPPPPPAPPQQLQTQPPVSHHEKEAAKYAAAAVDSKYSAMSIFNNNVVGYGAASPSAPLQPPVSKAKYPDYGYNGSGSGYNPPASTTSTGHLSTVHGYDHLATSAFGAGGQVAASASAAAAEAVAMSAAAAASSHPWGMDSTSVSLHAAAASAHSMTAASYYSHHPAFLSHHHPTAREFREAAGLQVNAHMHMFHNIFRARRCTAFIYL